MCAFTVTKQQKPGAKEINFLLDLSMEKHVCLHCDKATKARSERDKFPIRPFLLKVCKSMCAFMVTKLQKPGGKEINFLLDLRMEKHVCLHGDKAKPGGKHIKIPLALNLNMNRFGQAKHRRRMTKKAKLMSSLKEDGNSRTVSSMQ